MRRKALMETQLVRCPVRHHQRDRRTLPHYKSRPRLHEINRTDATDHWCLIRLIISKKPTQASRSSTSDTPSAYRYGAADVDTGSGRAAARGRRPLPPRPVRLRGVLARRVHHGRRRPQRLRPFRPAGGVARPRPAFWRWLQLHAQVPLRRVQRRDEARRRQLGRHCHLLLPDVRRGRRARRDRHGVHGQLQRLPDGAQHQRVGQRRRQEGAPVLPVVRPGRRLPQVQDRLERQEHHLPGGRRDGARLQALRRPAVPGRQAHGGARHAVGRQLLGHPEGQGAHRLVQRALRRLLPSLHRQRLRRRQRRQLIVPRRRGERVDGQAARRHGPSHRGLGAPELLAVQLLR